MNLILSKKTLLIYIFILLISILSIFKVPESDLSVYLAYLNSMENISFSKIFTSDTFVKRYEIVFKIYTWTVKNLFNQEWTYVFLSIFFIYHSTIKLTFNYIQNIFDYPINLSYVFLILSWCVLVAITFATATHLIRQYLSIVLFSYAIIALINKKQFLCILLIISSIMTHYSIIAITAVFFISFIFRALFKKINFFTIVLVILISFFLSYVVESIPVINEMIMNKNYSIPSEDGLNKILIIMDLFIFSLFYYLYKDISNNNLITLFSFVVFYIGFLITFHNYSYIFLRFYFVLDVIRALLGSLIILRINFNPKILFIPVSFILFASYFVLRMYISPWSYGTYHLGI